MSKRQWFMHHSDTIYQKLWEKFPEPQRLNPFAIFELNVNGDVEESRSNNEVVDYFGYVVDWLKESGYLLVINNKYTLTEKWLKAGQSGASSLVMFQ